MYAYFCLNAEYTVEDGEEIDEVKESDCLYDVSIDAKTDFDYSAARRVKVGTLGDLIEDTSLAYEYDFEKLGTKTEITTYTVED